jgi:hypothetical protein
MKVKHSRRQYKLTYKKKQYRLKNKKQKTKRTKRMKSNAKSSYGHFKKSIKYMQRGGLGLPTGWTEVRPPNGKTYYVNKTTKVSTWDRPKHDQWFGEGSFPPIPHQDFNLSTNRTHTITLSAQTVFREDMNKEILYYTGLPVRFVSENPDIASIDTVNGAILHIKSPGTTNIYAYQEGNDNFNPTDYKVPKSIQTVTVIGYYPPPPHPPPAHYQAPTAQPQAVAKSEEQSLHDRVFNFTGHCDMTSRLDQHIHTFKILIDNIEEDPKAYSLSRVSRGHTFLYSAFRKFGNVCLIKFMLDAGCIIMQPNKPVPKWMWEADDGSEYTPCDQETQDFLETTLVERFLKPTNLHPLVVNKDVQSKSSTSTPTKTLYEFVFDPTNIITSGTQVVSVDSAATPTKTDIIVLRDINGIWKWFMDDEEFGYAESINQTLEAEFKKNEGNGFCTFDNGTIISTPGQPTVNLIQVSFSTRVALRQTNRTTGSARSVIRVCNTSYPFHGAIERLRTAPTLDEAIIHGRNIVELVDILFRREMHLIKTLRNSIFDGINTRAFLVIDELLVAKQQLQLNMSGPSAKLQQLNEILDVLVKRFSINTTGEVVPGKPLTQCNNVRVTGVNTIEITIKSTAYTISEGSFIKFDRWEISYNPLTISLVPTKAIVVGFGGRFHPTDHEQSVVNRIFYWPWRNAEECWTTSSQYRSIGLKSEYLNDYWDSIKLIPCPASTGSPCTIDQIKKWQEEEHQRMQAKLKKAKEKGSGSGWWPFG